jgi:hypothetical protein
MQANKNHARPDIKIQEKREGKKMRKSLAIITLAVLLVGTSSLVLAQNKPAWQTDTDWAAHDTGAPDCPWLYVSGLADCLAGGILTGNHGGNRSCVIFQAVLAAKAGYDDAAFGMVLVTQCHNPTEAQNLAWAGPGAVANYLRGF